MLCRIDKASGLCLGCTRTEAEIMRWRDASVAEREAIWALLPQRRASLGVKLHRLDWSLADTKRFILETLVPDGGTWVSGLNGAVAEFCAQPRDEMTKLTPQQNEIVATTKGGAIRFTLNDTARAFSFHRGDPAQRDVIVLAVMTKHSAASQNSNEFDHDAIEARDREASLLDFRLGNPSIAFAIRTNDAELSIKMKPWRGTSFAEFMPELGAEFLRVSPTRIISNPLGRIEISAAIPRPGEPSPLGCHTHFLPDHLARGGALSDAMGLPEAFSACFVYYPPAASAAQVYDAHP